MSVKKIALISLMAAVICVCSWLTVPFTVPFTMQTFAVFLSLELLGGINGTAAVGVYILLGIVGLPVFSGFRGGLGHLMGPTGGYIIGFLFSGLFYILSQRILDKKNIALKIICRAVSLMLCYLVGTIWFVYVMGTKDSAVSVSYALSVCVLPFILPDAAKITLAVYIAKLVKRHTNLKNI